MDFRVGRRWLESFIAGAHPPVLFMKCIVSNQNLFEFHPCLAREARGERREAARVLEEVLLPGRFKGDEGRKRGEKVTEGAEREDGLEKEER